MRKKFYCFLVYPDISPYNWRVFCYRFFTKVYISDLHTDTNFPHYHVLLEFDKPIHVMRVMQLLEPIQGVNLCTVFDYKRYIKNYNCKLLKSISAADVEANREDFSAAILKRTYRDVKQRSAGDEVSLDQHIRLYQEVFNG